MQISRNIKRFRYLTAMVMQTQSPASYVIANCVKSALPDTLNITCDSIHPTQAESVTMVSTAIEWGPQICDGP